MHISKKSAVLLVVIISISVFVAIERKKHDGRNNIDRSEASAQNAKLEEKLQPEQRKIEVAVEEGDVFSKVGGRAGLDERTCFDLYESVRKIYDLADLKIGHKFVFYPDNNNQIQKIVYNADDEQELTISREATGTPWSAKLEKIDYEIKEKTIEGTVNNSLYQDALAQGAEDSMIMGFAENLEYSLDFSYDQRQGDKFKFVYEERYRDGKYVMPGKLLAGAYLNDGKLYQAFYFEESEKNKGYFDENGNSVKKMFLKAPVAFKYVSSPFTNGMRYVDAFEKATKHRAIDYATSFGTPIRAVGSGVVTFAGWSPIGYGNYTMIKHNGTYSTNYAHQSKILVKKGEHVSQGQVIGLVGSTGFSTGPHLHFEMENNGVKVDPGKEIMPPGDPISKDKKVEFMSAVNFLKEKIKFNN